MRPTPGQRSGCEVSSGQTWLFLLQEFPRERARPPARVGIWVERLLTGSTGSGAGFPGQVRISRLPATVKTGQRIGSSARKIILDGDGQAGNSGISLTVLSMNGILPTISE